TLFGTTSEGGANGYGTVFSLNTNGTGFSVMHLLAALDTFISTNSDGALPLGRLALVGNAVYGTAEYGGPTGWGTVFRVNIDGTAFTNLHGFSIPTYPDVTNNDGLNPQCGLIWSGTKLYGTAYGGGANGSGTVFALDPNNGGFTTLYAFSAALTNSSGLSANSDGLRPTSSLVLQGNALYGTTFSGGVHGYGTVFRINTDGSAFANLHNFAGDGDGANPATELVLSDNTLYGTTTAGGLSGFGTIFALTLPIPPAALTISVPEQLPNHQFQMLVNGSAGQTYTVQMSTNIALSNWMPILVTNATSGEFLFTDPTPTNQQRFYRVLLRP
ncbi:MAG: choice-of-anchor tandem repeat GloVer-containing protein, partial [Limisphaerales bacterium]